MSDQSQTAADAAPHATQIATMDSHARNPGIALDPAMFEGHAVNRSATERRAATLGTLLTRGPRSARAVPARTTISTRTTEVRLCAR